MLAVEDKGALAGVGHRGGKVPYSAELCGNVWRMGVGILCMCLLMLYKHEIGKIIKTVKEITKIEDEGKQV